MQAPAFELVGLTKTFGTTVAADHVDLAVPHGSFYGLVGPNGAGKTTSLSMGVGLLRPDAGTARVLGVDVWASPTQAKGMLGLLPDGLMLPERLTGEELLTYLGLLRGMPAGVVAARTAELLDVLGLDSAGETLVIEYSSGMRKKIGLAAALLHGPKVLVLDEPFESVDPVSASTIRTILRRYVEAGNTVVFSSHVMALVELLCTHVAVMSDGRVRAAGTLEDVRQGRSLERTFIDLVGAEVGGEEGLAWLAS
jgi:ABC-2 type transport system ATP-binding protein